MSLALLVQSGDKNAWVWPHWYHYWGKHGTPDLKCYFATENIIPPFSGVTCIASGGPYPWGKCMQKIIAQIPEDHVILFHEDYFITDKIDIGLLHKLHDIMHGHGILLLKCCGSWGGYDDANYPMVKADIPGIEVELWKYHNESQYLISHQESIWNKEFLLQSVVPNETPWQHEIFGTQRAQRKHPKVFAYRGAPPIPYQETVNHGQRRPGSEALWEAAK